MKQINIGIPEKQDFVRWCKILHFKLTGGFSCTKCGTKTDFNHVNFLSAVFKKRIMIRNNTAGICASCTRDELNKKAEVVFTEHNCTCDWCNETKLTTSFPRDKSLESVVHFGGQWWNGHHICQGCMNLAFDNREPDHSEITEYKNGRLYYNNELGIRIKPK
jgi:hypothetical protein